MKIVLIGCSHRSAPLAIREQLALTPPKQLRRFAAKYDAAELVVLSTCNRVEWYLARPLHHKPTTEELLTAIGTVNEIGLEELRASTYVKEDHDVVMHLFRVVSGLDSMVLGESQILGQVKQAYQWSVEEGTADKTLNFLFQRAFAVAKTVHSNTGIARGRVSVGSVAAQLAAQVFSNFNDKQLLLVGAGKMGELTAQHLLELGLNNVIVTNRSADKANAMARRYQAQTAPYEQLGELLARVDLALFSTGAPDPVLTGTMFAPVMKARDYRPLFLIDIAVPRDVEAAIGQHDNVYLYNVDDLQHLANQNINGRHEKLSAAGEILERETAKFLANLRQSTVGPVIQKLEDEFQQMAQGEWERLAPKLNDTNERQRELIRQSMQRLVNKVLHQPMRQLNSECREGHEGTPAFWAQILRRLFNLKD